MDKNILASLVIGNIIGIVFYSMFLEKVIPIQRVRD